MGSDNRGPVVKHRDSITSIEYYSQISDYSVGTIVNTLAIQLYSLSL